MRFAVLLGLGSVALLTLPACARAKADPPPPNVTPAAPVAAPPAAAPAPSPAPAANTPFPAKTYRAVLQTGDSMVGGGLCRALQPRFAAEGTKFIRDVWESGSIEDFGDSDRLSKLLSKHDPDLVLLTMGANDVGGNVTDYLGKKIDKIVAMTQKGHARDCVWIGPPKWRVNGKPVLDMIKAHVSPCVLFDSTDIEMHRKPDKIHPDEKGGDEWAVAFWHWFRGADADAGTFDIYTGVLH
jgi:lysophospholipase L1-like esterase